MRAAAFLIALLLALAQSGVAWAHASLVRAAPADGAVVAEPPASLRLTFNEPVSPLVMRLIAPDGTVTMPKAVAENTTVIVSPPPLQRGTHVLSWRVISADGHPVGGSLVFSVGEASAQPSPGAVAAGDPIVRASVWLAKLVIYAAIFVGIGGAFFRAWISEVSPPWLDRTLMGLIVAGLLVTPLSVGLQGLDALDIQLPALAQKVAWVTGLDTSYGFTAIAAAFALFAGLFSFEAPRPMAARALTLAAMGLAGLALALSGHASNALPQALTRPAVFVHVVCVAFWIGALLPLAASLVGTSLVGASVGGGDGRALARFNRAIPYPLAALVLSGAILAVVQLDRVDALWTTSYGIVLSCKLLAVAVLLALAVANRYALVPRYQAIGAFAAPPLTRTLTAELCIAGAIFALVALWRFTPPPRALAAAEPIEVHLHGPRAMAQLTLTPVRARDPRINVQVLDGEFNALAVKEVTLTLANPAAGIEPVRRAAVSAGDAHWRVEDLRIPLAGRWVVRVDLLIDDFEKIVLEDQVELPRLP